jgi:hypothetical protein
LASDKSRPFFQNVVTLLNTVWDTARSISEGSVSAEQGDLVSQELLVMCIANLKVVKKAQG